MKEMKRLLWRLHLNSGAITNKGIGDNQIEDIFISAGQYHHLECTWKNMKPVCIFKTMI